jgi:hypothetical protein
MPIGTLIPLLVDGISGLLSAIKLIEKIRQDRDKISPDDLEQIKKVSPHAHAIIVSDPDKTWDENHMG